MDTDFWRWQIFIRWINQKPCVSQYAQLIRDSYIALMNL